MQFTRKLWLSIQPIFKAYVQHPFAVGLSQGTLEPRVFNAFLAQDALYLQRYAQTLAVVATKASCATEQQIWLKLKGDVLDALASLHQTHFKAFNINPTDKLTPICANYTRFIHKTATQCSYAEAVAVILPCFRLYHEVGKNIYRDSTPNNPYALWIDTYNSSDFANNVALVIDMAERAAFTTTPAARQTMQYRFITASLMELAFLNSAYQERTIKPSARPHQQSYHGFWQQDIARSHNPYLEHPHDLIYPTAMAKH